MKRNYTEIETIIKERITKLEEDYELDHDDINSIRREAYTENGWSYDPFPEEDENEKEDEEQGYYPCTMEDKLRETGMSWRDFF